MSNFVNKLYQKNTIIYKVILFLITTVAIVYLFPKGGQFKYDFNNGQLWKYDNLYAPFDFAVQKSEAEVKGQYLHRDIHEWTVEGRRRKTFDNNTAK